MFKKEISEVFDILFPKDKIAFDGEQFVGFIDHQFIYGEFNETSIVLRLPDNDNGLLVANVRKMIKENGMTPRPDVRKVYNLRLNNGVQITFGELPWEWGPSETW